MKELKIGKKLVPLVVASTLSLSLGGCYRKVDMSELTFDELMSIDDVKNSTQLDELVLTNVDLANYLEYSDTLERYMDIVDLLKDIDFSLVCKLRVLDDSEYLETTTLSLEEIKELINLACNDSNNLIDEENRLYALKKLNYLNDHCKNWININGKDVSIKIMMAAVKTSVLDGFNLGVDEYSHVTLPALTVRTYNDDNHYVICVNDQIYDVDCKALEITNTISYIYQMQNSILDESNKFESFRKSLNYAKTTIAAGSVLHNNDITCKYDANYIEENFVKSK